MAENPTQIYISRPVYIIWPITEEKGFFTSRIVQSDHIQGYYDLPGFKGGNNL